MGRLWFDWDGCLGCLGVLPKVISNTALQRPDDGLVYGVEFARVMNLRKNLSMIVSEYGSKIR